MELTISNLRTDYARVVDAVLRRGHPVYTRGEHVRELLNVTLVLSDLDRLGNSPACLPVGVGRSVNLKLAAVEALQLIGGTFDPDLVLTAAPSFTSVLEDPTELAYGAYGPRVNRALDFVVNELRLDQGSRRCLVSIWRAADLAREGDRPCTIGLQFMIRHGALNLHAYMRANDVWLGLPYDLWSFTQLQHTVAAVLDVPAGNYYHNVTSLHLYERNRAAAENLSSPRPEPYLPTGLNLGLDREATWDDARQLARRLLAGTAGAIEAADNHWYARQLATLVK